MKYGEIFVSRQRKAWEKYYVNYRKLKKLLSTMEKLGDVLPTDGDDIEGGGAMDEVASATVLGIRQIETSFVTLIDEVTVRNPCGVGFALAKALPFPLFSDKWSCARGSLI